jgi:hypothetical protein
VLASVCCCCSRESPVISSPKVICELDVPEMKGARLPGVHRCLTAVLLLEQR